MPFTLPWSCFSTLFSSSRIEEISCMKWNDEGITTTQLLASSITLLFLIIKYCSDRQISVPCWMFSGVECHFLIAVYSQFHPSSCPYLWTKSWRKVTHNRTHGHLQWLFPVQINTVGTLRDRCIVCVLLHTHGRL